MADEPNVAADMLIKSADAVRDRQKVYGPPAENFRNIAALWREWLQSRYLMVVPLDATDVAAMSALIKLARLAETPDHEDSWVDVAGYAACGLQVTKK
jgi:hypothetical protein